MANDYYAPAFTGQRHSLVKAEHFMAMDAALVAAFDKLPGLRALLEDRVTALVATGGPTNYTVRMNPAPTAYTDGIALQVRFPVANAENPTLDILNADGVSLGAKPIRQVDGTALSAGHVAQHARGELYYVTQDAGYWTLGAGARGAQGPAGPPDGTFSLNASRELVFTATAGTVTNLGPAAPLWRGNYAAGTTYRFMQIARVGRQMYLHVGLADTTGTAVTDTSVWQPLARDGYDAAIAFEFSTSTSMADPGAGQVRLNNASPASVTRIAIDDTDADGNGVGAYIATFNDTGEANGHGHLFIRDVSDDDLLVYRVNGLSDIAGWTRLDVTHVAGTARPTNGARLGIWFSPTGNKGTPGSASNGRDGYDAAIAFEFSTSTTMGDPAAGDIRLNNASPASVTRIAIDDTDADGNAVGGYVATFDDNGAPNDRGHLFIRDTSNDALLIYRVQTIADNSGWTRLDVAHVAGTARPANDARLAVWFLPKGDDGEKGSIFVPPSGVAQSGTGNAVIALTPSPAATAYAAGDTYEFVLKSDISADASINVSGRGNKNFSFTSALRIRSLKAGYVLRAVYDGTRFLLGSLAAAVFAATAVTFTASDASYAWPYAATKALMVIEGAGGGGGAHSSNGRGGGGGGGSGNSYGGRGGGEGAEVGSQGTASAGGDGGAGSRTGAINGGDGGDGGDRSSATVLGSTYHAESGGGGGGGGTLRSSHGGGGGSNGSFGFPGGTSGVGAHGSGGNARNGGSAASGNRAGAGGGGHVVAQLVTGLSVGTTFEITIGAGGRGAISSLGSGGDGGNGRVTLYPIWS